MTFLPNSRLALVLAVAALFAPGSRGQAPVPVPGTWEFVGGRGISPGPSLPGMIAIDARGVPYASYKDLETAQDQAFVVRWDEAGSAWQVFGGAASIGNAWYNRLTFDGRGAPFVVARDYALGGRFNARRFHDGAWHDLGPPLQLGEAHYTSIAVARGNVPVVAYQDRGATPPDATSVQAYLPGSGWRLLGVRGFSGAPADYQSIASNSLGVPFVAIADHAHEGRVSVFRWTPPTWTPVGGRGDASDVRAHNVTLAVDGVDRLYVAYRNWHDYVAVRRFDDGTWAEVGVTHASADDAPVLETEHWRQWLSLAFDGRNVPYVAYQLEGSRVPVVRRLQRGTGRWRALGEAVPLETPADYLTLAVGRDGVPYIAFRDAAAEDRLSVMRFVEQAD